MFIVLTIPVTDQRMTPTKFLSPQGYSVSKEALSDEELKAIKDELTVSPHVPEDFKMGQVVKYKLYQEGPTKIYMPKHYAFKKFGAPDVNRLNEGLDINIQFQGSLRPEQAQPVAAFMRSLDDPCRKGGILNLTCASGKCLARNTPVMMYDGSVKYAQDVCVGDVLMGDDSAPRYVQSITSGYDTLYTVHQDFGNSYTVNKSHILSLMHEDTKHILDIEIEEYLRDKHTYRAYKGFKVPVQFKRVSVSWDPYVVGHIYGSIDEDGHIDHTLLNHITLSIYEQAISLKCRIPLEYKANDRHVQLAFLRGFEKGKQQSRAQVHASIREDINFMYASLGVYGGVHTLQSECMYNIHIEDAGFGEYYGFTISGNRRFLLGDFTVTHNTVMAIYLMCQVAKKTMVIVHKDFLLQQWKERIEQFCPSARVGLIKGKVIDVDDKDVVLASLQSLSMKEYDKSTFDGFGFVIVDEVHHTSAEVFSRALRKVCFTYTLGLSATIKRKDGLSKVFMWYLGDVLYSNVKSSKRDVVDVRCMPYYSPDAAYSREVYMMRDKLNIPKMINNICEYEPRMEFIVDAIKDVMTKEPERRVIVLSDRRAHLERLGMSLIAKGIECGYYFGGMKQPQLKESETKQVILGTYCMVSEGFDCKFLDTLVIASPKSDVVQSVGRILREEASKRKHTPLILDVIDKFSVFENQAKKRVQYYKKQKYRITGLPKEKENDNKLVKLENLCCVDICE